MGRALGLQGPDRGAARLPGIANIGYRGGISVYYRDPKNQMVVYMVDEGWCRILPEFQMTPARCRQLQAMRTGIFVSRQIAERFHLKPGDVFPVLTKAVTRADGGKAWPFTVLGVLEDIPGRRTGYGIGNYAYLDESRLLAQRGTVGGIFVDVSVPDPAVAAKTALAIEALFANSGYPVSADTDLAEAQARSRANVNIPFVTMVVAGAGLFMVLFLAGNGIYQSVRERIPEFAIMKTLGFSDWGLMALVFAEAASSLPAWWLIIGLGFSGGIRRENTQSRAGLQSAAALSAGLVAWPRAAFCPVGGPAQRRPSGLAPDAARYRRRAVGQMTC